MGLLTATPRIGVKPDKVDFEMMQDGEAAIFILFGVLYIQAKPEKEYSWENVYPELVGGEAVARPAGNGLANLANQSGLGTDVVENLTKSLKGLTETANSLQEISKATGAANERCRLSPGCTPVS